MNTKQFNNFIVRPATNGLIVEPLAEPHKTISPMDTYVFTDFADFIKWVESQILDMPKDIKYANMMMHARVIEEALSNM